MHVLSEIIHAFEAANDIDSTIPKLVPISTRRLLGKRRRKVASADVAPTPVPKDALVTQPAGGSNG